MREARQAEQRDRRDRALDKTDEPDAEHRERAEREGRASRLGCPVGGGGMTGEPYGYRVLMRVLFGLGGEPPAWRERAACAGSDPDLFHNARRITAATLRAAQVTEQARSRPTAVVTCLCQPRDREKPCRISVVCVGTTASCVNRPNRRSH